MSHTSEISVFKPTNELVQIFGSPALAGAEKLEDYEKFFANVFSAMKPSDAIMWLFTKDVADWSWEIRRERSVKAEVAKYYYKEVVGELIKSELAPSDKFETAYFRVFQANSVLESWASDPKARAEIDQQLAAKGYEASFILAQAYLRSAAQIEAIDKRILRFMSDGVGAALRDAGVWSDRLLRRLDEATPEVIEGEFTEAAKEELMSSDRKITANRSNAKKSTGPRSEAGRDVSCRNAQRHGLAIDIGNDPVFRDDIQKLAQAFAHSSGVQNVSERARETAEAEPTCCGSARSGLATLRDALFRRYPPSGWLDKPE